MSMRDPREETFIPLIQGACYRRKQISSTLQLDARCLTSESVVLEAKGFDSLSKWRQGKAGRCSSFFRPRSVVQRFSMGARGKRRSSRAEALAPHAAASKGSSARPSVSAPPLFPRTIYIMYDCDVPTRPAGPGLGSCQVTSHITTVHCPPEVMCQTTCYLRNLVLRSTSVNRHGRLAISSRSAC